MNPYPQREQHIAGPCVGRWPQMSYPNRFVTATSLCFLGFFAGCTSVPPTVDNDPSLDHVELQGYRFHVRRYGDKSLPPIVVVHGGPGGDSKYLYPIQGLAKNNHVIFYDQRGTGLSPRVHKEALTLDISLDDLHAVVSHYGGQGQVKLIGHSWGAMLVLGYLGRHPERVSHAVGQPRSGRGARHPESALRPGVCSPLQGVAIIVGRTCIGEIRLAGPIRFEQGRS